MGEYADDAIERSFDEMFFFEENPWEDGDEPDSMRWANHAPVFLPGFNRNAEKCHRCFGVVDSGRMIHAVDCFL